MARAKRESVEEKGRRLFAEGRVYECGRGLGVYVVSGDSGAHEVWGGRCNCLSRVRCSHEVAAELAEQAAGQATSPRARETASSVL
jgi:hypothetical protein